MCAPPLESFAKECPGRFRHMHAIAPKLMRAVTAVGLLLPAVAPVSRGQSDANKSSATVEGFVRDSSNHAIAGATVILLSAEPSRYFTATTDSLGHFRFDSIASGTYKLRAKAPGPREAKEVQFVAQPNETKSVVLFLVNEQAFAANDASAAIEFSDEPRFTVAGVTDPSALGGHGSDRAVRNSDALSKEAVALAREKSNSSHAARNIPAPAVPTEAELRASLAQKETADAHFQLAEIEEGSGRPLEAVKDYQRAAELQPSEPHLFAWGAELLLHHAAEPATEVFAKGHRVHPRSVRMMLGLGAAQYAQGFKEDAAKIALDASDLDPYDPAPYLLLGRIQEIENSVPPGWVERMERFVRLHPGTAMAHYLFAVGLARSGGEQQRVATVEAQLETAIQLDPGLGKAYLQLGILRSQRNDDAGAILAFQKAIETTPLPDEAHYRLAAIYRRKGEKEKAAKETELFKQYSEQKRKDAEVEHREIKQFVYTLRGQNTSSQAPPAIPAPR
jgi:tetratricopeptide (TPR) repeat protein